MRQGLECKKCEFEAKLKLLVLQHQNHYNFESIFKCGVGSSRHAIRRTDNSLEVAAFYVGEKKKMIKKEKKSLKISLVPRNGIF